MSFELYIENTIRRTSEPEKVSYYGQWIMQIGGTPLANYISFDSDGSAATTVLINQIDDNNSDRKAYLDSLQIGDIIKHFAINFPDPDPTVAWQITGISKPSADVWDFSISYISGAFPQLAGEDYNIYGPALVAGMSRADLYPDEGITLKRQILSETGIDNSNKQFTREFTIPATPTNNELLNHWELKSNETVPNPNKAIVARIEIDDIYTIQGTIELLSVTWKKRQPESYMLTFYGDISSLRGLLGDTYLEDVDWSDFEFIWSKAAVELSWQGGLNGGNVFIPIIAWKRWYEWHTSGTNENDIATEATGVLLSELRVGLRLKDMIVAIAATIGKTIVFDGLTDSYLDNAFVIPSKFEDQALTVSPSLYQTSVKSIDGAQEVICPAGASIADAIIIPLSQITSDPTGRWTNSTTYTAEFDGDYTFEITYQSSRSAQRYLYMVLDGTLTPVGPEESNGTNTNGTFVFSRTLTAGVAYNFVWYANQLNNNDVQMFTLVVPVSIIGTTYDASVNMPPIKAADFLTGFLDAFNLLMFNTNLNEYTIIDLYSLYSLNAEPVDLESYVDELSLTYKKLRVYGEINFKHRQNTDFADIAYFDITGKEFGELIYSPDIDFSDGTFEKESIFNVFPPTYMDTYDAGGVNGRTDLWCHFQLSNDAPLKPVLANFLLLYRNSVLTNTNYPYYLQEGTNPDGSPSFGAAMTTWGKYSQIQDDVSLVTSNALTYSIESPYAGVSAQNTITNVFFTRWLLQLYKRTAYTLEISFPINFGIYLKISEINLIYLNGFYHFLAAWEYNSGTNMLTIRLLRQDDANTLSVSTREENGKLKLIDKYDEN